MRRTLILSLWLPAALLAAGPRWQLQYFYDSDTDSFNITDFQVPTAERGIAVGYFAEGRKTRPAALITTDGGRKWSQVRLPAIPSSVYFLNDRLGWMLARQEVWQSTDFGQTWKRVGRAADAVEIYFRDESLGWAVGPRKSISETRDGGRKWSRVAAADQPKTSRDTTVYDSVAFANDKLGMIAGWSKPPRRNASRLPDWMEPGERPREWPGTTILLITRDGGRTWTPQETSMFGQVTRVRLSPDGRGLGLVEFLDAFDWPSEVFRIDWRSGRSQRVFRQKDRVVTDVLLPAGPGPAYLAAIEPEGRLPRSPVPGKLKVLRSEDLATWTEMPVDYRAVARRALLAGPDGQHLWVAADTGMILKLVAE